MATINTSGALDNTTVISDLTITVKSRSATSVTFSYSIATGFKYSSGSTSANYEKYSGKIEISGTSITTTSTTVTLKELSEAWSGAGTHSTKTGTITVNTSSASNLTATIKYTVTSSKDSSNSNTGSTTLSTGAGAITPTAPTISLAAKPSNNSSYYYIGYNPDNSVTITCSGGSNIARYKYQYSVGSGWVDLTTTTSSSYTATGLPTLAVGQSLSFQVVVYSSTNNTATATSKTLYYRYHTPDMPTIISPTTKTVVNAGVALNIAWTAPVQTVTGYSLEIVIDGTTTSLGTVSASTLSYTYSTGLSNGSEAYLRVAAYNDSATSAYAQSPKFTTIGVIPVMVPCYVMVNGNWQPVTINNMTSN